MALTNPSMKPIKSKAYTNLKWIFDTATVPLGADARELSYYISMIDGLSGEGHLPEVKTTRLISELKKRIEEIA